MQVPDVELPNSLDAIYDRFTQEGWGDGLPIIPPTSERVHEMLQYTDREPEEVIGAIPNGWGEASVLLVTVNAVMAGWDTDCNGATVGGLMGLSGARVPEHWTDPWAGKIGVSLAGLSELQLDDVVGRTVSVARGLEAQLAA